MKDYQTLGTDAAIPLPDSVRLAVEDIAGVMREGCLLWPCPRVSL